MANALGKIVATDPAPAVVGIVWNAAGGTAKPFKRAGTKPLHDFITLLQNQNTPKTGTGTS